MLQTQNNCHINTTTRTIFLGDDIDEKSMSYIQFYLLELIHADDAKDSKEKDFKREPIKMYINSHGGSVDNMWGLLILCYIVRHQFIHTVQDMLIVQVLKSFWQSLKDIVTNIQCSVTISCPVGLQGNIRIL